MGSNVHLLYDTRTWDAGTATASTAATGFAASKVFTYSPGEKWRTTSKTGQTLTIDLGSAFLTTMMGLFAHNLTASATVYHLANTSNSWGSPAYTSSAIAVPTDADSRVLPRMVWTLSQTYRWHRLTLDDPSNTASYLEVGRLMGGQYYEFVRNIRRKPRISHLDPTPKDSVPGTVQNIQDVGREKRFRRFTVDFPFRTVAERRKMVAIFGLIGNSRPVVLALDPTNYLGEMSAYCFLETNLEEVWEHAYRWDVLSLVFEEKTF